MRATPRSARTRGVQGPGPSGPVLGRSLQACWGYGSVASAHHREPRHWSSTRSSSQRITVGERQSGIGRHTALPALDRQRPAGRRSRPRCRRRPPHRQARPAGEGATLRAWQHLQGDCLADAGGCGADLSGAPGTAEQRRQVIDLPVVTPEVTEHWAQTRVCAGCGTATTAAFPDTMRAPVAHGGGSALHYGRKPET